MIKFLLLLSLIHSPAAHRSTIAQRFPAPKGYTIVALDRNSFGYWLRNLPLKPAGTHTLTYRGDIARTTDAYTAAVVDMSVGKTDLQQCADAVMRLRAEFLYSKKDYKAIHFNFTSGFNCDFIRFADGYRYREPGKWVKMAKSDYSYANFMRYMNLVFMYAGTISLNKELVKVNNEADLKEGDVFIYPGSPGHCFIVVNVATNNFGKKRFMIAQSYMPAQNIQVLQDNGSPWLSMDIANNLPAGGAVNLFYLKRF